MRYTTETLRYLVKCAKDKEYTNYATLSVSIGINNTRSANIAFGAVGQLLRSISEQEALRGANFKEVPDITTIVTHTGKRTCGDGVITHGNPSKLSERQKEERVNRERQRTFSFQKWDKVLAIARIVPLN